MKVLLRSQKPRRAQGSHTRFLSRQPRSRGQRSEVRGQSQGSQRTERWDVGTIEPLDAPDVILADVPLASVGGVGVH